MVQIEIANRQSLVELETAPIVQLLQNMFLEEGFSAGEISLAFVDDREIHDVNRQFLNHDYPTDVISFLWETSSDIDATSPSLEGEIVVSVEMARRIASENNWCINGEILLYCLHGGLHLCGYDDLTDADAQVMKEREQHYLLANQIDPRISRLKSAEVQ